MRRFLVPQVECTPCLAWRLHENDIVTQGARLHTCLPVPPYAYWTGIRLFFFFTLRLQCELLPFVSALTACRNRDTVSTILRIVSSMQIHMHLSSMVCI